MGEVTKLPPLPEPFTYVFPDVERGPLFHTRHMQDYALAAIEADRQQRGEPVGYVHPANEHRLYSGETVAFRQRPYEGERQIPVYLSPQPAAPTPDWTNINPIIVKYFGDDSAGAARAQMAIEEALCTSQPAEPHTEFDDPRVQQVYEIICGDNHPPAGEHWDGYVSRLIVDALFSGQTVEPVKVPSASEIDDDFQNWLYLGQTYYEPDDLNKQSKEVAQAAWKDAASRYSHPVEPDGWQLVPKEPTPEMVEQGIFSAHGYPAKHRVRMYYELVWEGMLAAAPKFGEEDG